MENKAKWNVSTKIEKYNTREDLLSGNASEIRLIDGNILLDAGVTDLWNIVIGENNQGGAIEAFDSDHAYIGVGDSAVAAIKSQAGLQATTNIWYKGMDVGYPAVNGNKVTFKSTFTGTGSGGNAEAPFTWNEWSVARGVASPSVELDDVVSIAANINKNLNRKVEIMGTKAAAATWVMTVEISLT